jgi:hypothetical protein
MNEFERKMRGVVQRNVRTCHVLTDEEKPQGKTAVPTRA